MHQALSLTLVRWQRWPTLTTTMKKWKRIVARKKSSPVEDLLGLVTLMPWWVGVALALVSYVVLHRMAAPAAPAGVQAGQMAGLAVHVMVAGLATFGQYLVPLICLAGAAMSVWKRRQRQLLVANAKGADSLDGMSWREFEILVGEAFRLQGYKVSETGGGGPDGGVDLVLTKGAEKFLVQCKQWKAFKVGVDVVRELYGVMAASGAAGGFVVTSGSYTNDARAFSDGRNVKLIDGQQLFGMVKQAKQSLAAQPKAPPSMSSIVTASSDPACPVCASHMVKRTAKKGQNAGTQFWGCSKYPTCRGTLPTV